MKYRLTTTGMAIILMTGCAMLTDLAMDAISPDKGGISTELIVGDKTQTLGISQDVNASNIGKVVGVNDNSVMAQGAGTVTVINSNLPNWLIALGVFLGLLGWLLPTPTTMWNYFRRDK